MFFFYEKKVSVSSFNSYIRRLNWIDINKEMKISEKMCELKNALNDIDINTNSKAKLTFKCV